MKTKTQATCHTGGPLQQPVAQTPSILAAPIGTALQTTLVAQLSDELGFLWDDANVPQELQARLVQMGFRDLNTWARVDDTVVGVRAFITEEAGLLRRGNDLFRSLVGYLIGTWETAQARGNRKREEEAEQRVGDLPRRLTDERHADIVQGYEDAHHELKEERDIPAEFSVEAKRTMLENRQDDCRKAL